MKTMLAFALALALLAPACGRAPLAEDSPPDLGSPPAPDLAPALPGGVSALSGYDPSLPDDDLAPLGALVGDRAVVGVGESIHTSGGYQLARARVIRYLVEHKNFRLIAIEWQRVSGAVVESFLNDNQGTADDAAMQLSVWSSKEVSGLLQWLHDWNANHPNDRVHFMGFDVQQPQNDLKALQTYFNAAAPNDAPTLLPPLDKCDTGAGLTSGAVTYLGDYQMCSSALDSIDSYLTNNQSALVAMSSLAQYQATQIASIGLRAWQGEAFYYNSNIEQSYQSRDDAMAKVYLSQHDNLYPNVKTIVWAHNYHLRMQGAQVSGFGAVGAPTMGTTLAGALGDQYFPIGQIAYDIAIDWPNVGCGAQPAPDSGSIPDVLGQMPIDAALVDLSFSGTPAPPFVAAQSYEESTYESLIPAQQYRALIFLRHSPKMTPLDWPSCQ